MEQELEINYSNIGVLLFMLKKITNTNSTSKPTIHQIFSDLIPSREPFLSMKLNYRFCVSDREIRNTKGQLIIAQKRIRQKNLTGYEDYIREHSQFKEKLSDKSLFISKKMQLNTFIKMLKIPIFTFFPMTLYGQKII